MEKIKVFVSYAKDDFDFVKPFIKSLQNSPVITINGVKFKYKFWWDYYMLPGEEWKNQIIDGIKNCDVFLGIVTENFISSSFIRYTELPLAIERNKEVGIQLIGLLWDECHFGESRLSKYELLPKMKGRLVPFSKWGSKREAMRFFKHGLKLAALTSMNNLKGPLKEARGLVGNKFNTIHNKQFLNENELKKFETLKKLNEQIDKNHRRRHTVEVKIFKDKKQERLFYYFLGIAIVIKIISWII